MFTNQIPVLDKKRLFYKKINELEIVLPEDSSVFLQSAYFSSLEEAGIPGVDYRYCPHYEDGHLCGLYYFQIINLSAQELGQIIHFEPYDSLLSGVSMLIQKLLFGVKKDKPHYLIVSGNLCLSGPYGISHQPAHSAEIYRSFPETLAALCHELEKSGKVVAEIVKDYPAEQDPLFHALTQNRFNLLSMEPVMKMKLPDSWHSMNDYVEALSSKYRQRYNQARKKLEGCEIKTITPAFISKNSERMNTLYKAVQGKSPVRIVKPDVNYLLALSKNLGDRVNVKGIFKDNLLLAFFIGIRDQDHYEAHHIGIDYQYNKEYSLYLNLLYEYIKMAIDSKSELLSFGRTAMEMKTTVGAVSHNYHTYIKLNNRLLNSIIKKIIPEEVPANWIPRDPFRK